MECAFGVFGKILMKKFNGIYLVRFGLKMWEILVFNWFLQNSNKFQKTKFWNENLIEKECCNTWRCTIQFKHDFISYLVVQKIYTDICKTMVTCWVSLFCNGFTLGPMTQTTLVYMKVHAFVGLQRFEDNKLSSLEGICETKNTRIT